MTTAIKKATGRPASMRAHLGQLRRERALPRDDRQLVARFQELVRSNNYAVRRAAIVRDLELLERQGTERLTRVMDEVFADPKAGEEILNVIMYDLPEARQLNLLATILSGIQFDRAQKAVAPILASQEREDPRWDKPDILFYLYKKDGKFAVRLLLEITNDSSSDELSVFNIWCYLLKFCFVDQGRDRNDKIGAQIIGDVYRQAPDSFLRVMLLIARGGKAFEKKYPSYDPLAEKHYNLIIKALRDLPPEISSAAVNHLFQHEPETLAKIISINTLFPSPELIQNLYSINKQAAVFVLGAILKRRDVIRKAHIMAFGRPGDAVEGLPRREVGRKIAAAAGCLGQNPAAFMAREAIEHAQTIEHACGSYSQFNFQLLEAFLASLNPEEINARLLIYGLLIWETREIFNRLGWEYDETAWKRINVIRLLTNDARFLRFGLHVASESIWCLAERFALKLQRGADEIALFTDVLAEVAEIDGDEYVAELLGKVAEGHEEAEPFIQAVALEIDRKRGAAS